MIGYFILRQNVLSENNLTFTNTTIKPLTFIEANNQLNCTYFYADVMCAIRRRHNQPICTYDDVFCAITKETKS